MTKECYCFAPYLLSNLGHHYAYNMALQSVMHNLGISSQMFVGEKCTLNLSQEWHKILKGGSFSLLKTFFRIFRKENSDFVLHTIEAFRTRELCFLFLAFLCAAKKRSFGLAIVFRYHLNFWPTKGLLHKIICKAFRLFLKNHLWLLTDSELIAKEYRLKWREQVFLLPIPHIRHISLTKFSHKKRYIGWWAGPPRPSKGLYEIKVLGKQAIDSRIQVKLSEEIPLTDAVLIKKELTPDEYWKEMQTSDCLLLPYDPNVYIAGTSGIFVEGVCSGKMVFVKAGSWLAYELSKFDLQELIIDWKSKYLVENIVSCIENFYIQKKLKEMTKAYRAFHNENSFQKSLKEALSI